jgi:hypothetical protein
LVLAAVLLLVAGLGVWYVSTARHRQPAALLARLPTRDSLVLRIDFATLRRAGILDRLAGSAARQEKEYTDFVRDTGFAYQRDLDSAWVSFHPDGFFALALGQFDWKRLEEYATANGGGCFQGLCRMPGSEPSRRISYLLVQRGLLALAVSSDDFGATRMAEPARGAALAGKPDPPPAADPVWLSIAPARLRRAETFPEGTQLLAKALADATSVNLTIGAGEGASFAARLEARFSSEEDAQLAVRSLDRITEVLGQIVAKERKPPPPGDLIEVLLSGRFTREGSVLQGRWTLSAAFLETLAEQAP